MAVSRTTHSYGLLLVVQILFGLFPVVAKQLLQPAGPLDPYSLLAIRVAGAAVCLVALHAVLVKKPLRIGIHGPRVAGLALLGVILNMGMFMVGLQLTDPAEAVLVITTIPVFTYGIAVALGREPLGPRRAAGIVLAIVGVAYLTLSRAHLGQAHVMGDLLVLGNALSYAAFLVLAKPLIEEYDALSLIMWVFVIGAAVFVPLGLAHGLRGELALLQPADWGRVAFVILGASVATYVFNTIALRHVPASTVAFFTYVQPVFTAVFAWFLLQQALSLAILPAAALIFAGVWLVARKNPKVLEGDLIGE
ncbi:MAG: DMT family transporter [bacterium]